ncbi:MAG: hypothetical protein KGH58_00905 [Candidatus Micrarchaeota archaeon]|nr:hypothetical protein [Candidatus Micrarchaeota archaeon]
MLNPTKPKPEAINKTSLESTLHTLYHKGKFEQILNLSEVLKDRGYIQDSKHVVDHMVGMIEGASVYKDHAKDWKLAISAMCTVVQRGFADEASKAKLRELAIGYISRTSDQVNGVFDEGKFKELVIAAHRLIKAGVVGKADVQHKVSDALDRIIDNKNEFHSARVVPNCIDFASKHDMIELKRVGDKLVSTLNQIISDGYQGQLKAHVQAMANTKSVTVSGLRELFLEGINSNSSAGHRKWAETLSGVAKRHKLISKEDLKGITLRSDDELIKTINESNWRKLLRKFGG